MVGMRVISRPDRRHPDLAVAVAGPLGDTAQRPVVLVHGMGGDHTAWRRFSRDLRSAGRPVVAVDLRGHGRSGHAESYRLGEFADDLRVVADELGLDRFDLVGHSLGAHTALRVAMTEGDRVQRLVVEEPPPMPRNDDDLAESIVPTASLGERIRGLRALAANPRPFLAFDRALPDQVGSQFQAIDTQWWDELSQISASALVISGGAASFLPSRHLSALAEAIPAAGFTTIETGHSVHRDRPREFAEHALGHLNAAAPGA